MPNRNATLMRGALAALALALVSPAAAGSLYQERVHADSFGNLVIHSPAGYKRIVVGQGHAAEAYNLTGSWYEPEVVYLDEAERRHERVRCNRPPVLLHGRSYMYGLPDNVVPVPAGLCR